MAVGEIAAQAGTLSVCVIRTRCMERRAGLSAIAEVLAETGSSEMYVH